MLEVIKKAVRRYSPIHFVP